MASHLLRTSRASVLGSKVASPSAALFSNFRRAAPAAVLYRGVTNSTRRPAQFEVIKDDADLIAQQRLRRPLSPHLSIYRWQITSVPSTLMRLSGVTLGGVTYLFGMFYLISPTIGWDLSSAGLAASFAALPLVVKVLAKAVIVWPFAFHFFNAFRFISWDFLIGLNNKAVSQTGWALVGASTLATLAFALFI